MFWFSILAISFFHVKFSILSPIVFLKYIQILKFQMIIKCTIFISAFKNCPKKGERVNDVALAGNRMWMCGILIFAHGKTEHERSNLSCSRFAIGFSLSRLPLARTIVI